MDRVGHVLLLYQSEQARLARTASWLRAQAENGHVLACVASTDREREQMRSAMRDRGFSPRLLRDVGPHYLAWSDLGDALPGLVRDLVAAESRTRVSLAVPWSSTTTSPTGVARKRIEHRLSSLAPTDVAAVLCTYDARTTSDEETSEALDDHLDWIAGDDLAVRRRGAVLRVEGVIDSLDADLVRQSLCGLVARLPAGQSLVLDLRRLHALTLGGARALVQGTRPLRAGGGVVRCAVRGLDVGELLQAVAGDEPGFDLLRDDGALGVAPLRLYRAGRTTPVGVDLRH